MNTSTEHRKVVVAKYYIDTLFVIPKGLDLEDKEKVSEWFVRWDTLHIFKTDGEHLEIEAHVHSGGGAQQYPDETHIKHGCDEGLDEDNLTDGENEDED